jgi:hypothetical protein
MLVFPLTTLYILNVKPKTENRKPKMRQVLEAGSIFAFAGLSLVAFSGWAAAATAANPYQTIVERNVFGLVPIPTAPPPDASAAAKDLPKITPNGIMTLFGKLQVLFKVAVPGQPAGKEDAYVMCEGDRQDEIEVQKIDEKSATITFNNHGVVQTLALVEGKASGGTPAGGAPGVPRLPNIPGHPPVPGAARPLGFGGHFGSGAAQASAAGNPGSNNGSGLGGANSGVSSQNQEPPLTPEAQVLMIEAQRMKYMEEGDPTAKILPPTDLTPEVTGQGGSGDGSGGSGTTPNPNGP